MTTREGDVRVNSYQSPDASTRCQIPREEPRKPRTCQRCARELPEQRTGRPRKYCTRCNPPARPPKLPDWAADYAERLRAAHAAAVAQADPSRRGYPPSRVPERRAVHPSPAVDAHTTTGEGE